MQKSVIPFQPQELARQHHNQIEYIADATRAGHLGISRIYAEGAYLSFSTLQACNGLIQAAAFNGATPEQVASLQAYMQDYLTAMQGIARSGAGSIYGYINNLPPPPEPNLLERLQRLLEG